MGPCNSTTSTRKETTTRKDPSDETVKKKSLSEIPKIEKKFNPHSLITGINDQIVIKHINDINGDEVKIDRCKNSTIIIMDISAQVIIYDCQNCNFFIAPCKGSISLRKSENIRIISASQQFRCTDITNCRASVYANSQPSVEKVKNFKLGCFFFMYTELSDLFMKAELSPWDNTWSEFHDYTPSINETPNITYFNSQRDSDFMDHFTNALKDQEISVDQYFPVPFTQGLSLSRDSGFKNMFLFFRESCVDQMKVYELLSDEMLKSLNTYLVRSVLLEKSDKHIVNLQDILKRNKKNPKAEFFNISNTYTNEKTQNNLNVKPSPNFVSNNGFVLLWLVNDDNFTNFLTLIEDEFENCLCVNEEDVGKMEDHIKRIFPNFI